MKRKQKVDLVPFAVEIPNGHGSYWSAKPGSLLEYADAAPGKPSVGIEWRANEVFLETLWIDGTERGRSAARFIWRDGEGHTFPMFLIDTVETLKHGVQEGGWLTAKWLVAKRGQNYGIRLAEYVLDNDKQAESRALISEPSEQYLRVGLSTGSVQHLVDAEHARSRSHDPKRWYTMCFGTRIPQNGWITGEKIEKREMCKECADRYNARAAEQT